MSWPDSVKSKVLRLLARKIIAVLLVHYTANNAQDASKQASMQTNTGEGNNLRQKKAWQLDSGFRKNFLHVSA